MNDNPYRVDLAELQSLIDDAKRLDAQIEARADAIRRQVDQLHVQWTGAAATAHQHFVDRWTADTAAMREALTTLQAALTRAHGNYSGAVDVNKGMWPLS
ncbi:WXG100 family type VII secretion target [Nocardia sp. NEAU-G5]|uniref:ESAT-6-like protein n=1 Tax=Nocardia albiluteola TaxID=2842303 RepID=A0ABS6B9J0_9NOCA|nr:WXG100 family type VII secretion target [Nocardia albiluteola]MBU3066406.1 WXG100 family type VII secretion target [Nocardia albiluteola]